MAEIIDPWFSDAGTLPQRSRSQLAQQMKPSEILAIADEVRALKAKGAEVANFTIGDFSPSEFRVPPRFLDHLQRIQNQGETNYPPAVGVAELRQAVRRFYARELDLAYPEGSVQIGSGARPLIYAAFACIISPGDTVLYQAPSWNTAYYADLNFADATMLVAEPERGFMRTAADLAPHLDTARLLVINSPQNPSGTAISRQSMTDICTAIVQENRRRETVGQRPLFLIYDMVYWQLTLDGVEHVTPVGCVPEMAKYTVMVDAVSKSWAATGVRVGWAVGPPWLMAPMKALIGHMGAWAGRAPQLATAATLDDFDAMAPWMEHYRNKVAGRQQRIYDRLAAMAAEGLPVEPVQPEGALYVTARFPLHGKTVGDMQITSDQDIRRALLHHAGTAVVPFVSFGYPDGTGWMRFSIGAVTDADIVAALDRIGDMLRGLSA
ncbi:MAG: pyridoxal phosphate-dependent aminotransferase [Myxococcota bacterium]